MLTPTACQDDLDHHQPAGDPRAPRWSRRALIGTSLSLGGFSLIGVGPALAADALLRPTDTDDIGPFHPQSSTASDALDLTRIKGHGEAALVIASRGAHDRSLATGS